MEDIFNQAIAFLMTHFYPSIMVAAGSVIGYYRWPQIKGLVSNLASGVVSKLPTATPAPVVPVTSNNVLSLVESMVGSLGSIKDENLHKQAVEAAVSFAEAVIREAGLLPPGEKSDAK